MLSVWFVPEVSSCHFYCTKPGKCIEKRQIMQLGASFESAEGRPQRRPEGAEALCRALPQCYIRGNKKKKPVCGSGL